MFGNIATQPGGPPSFITGNDPTYSPQQPGQVAGPANPMDYGMQQPQQPPGPQMGFGMPPQQDGQMFSPGSLFDINQMVNPNSGPALSMPNAFQPRPQQQPQIGFGMPPQGQQVGGPVNPNRTDDMSDIDYSKFQSNF